MCQSKILYFEGEKQKFEKTVIKWEATLGNDSEHWDLAKCCPVPIPALPLTYA